MEALAEVAVRCVGVLLAADVLEALEGDQQEAVAAAVAAAAAAVGLYAVLHAVLPAAAASRVRLQPNK